MRIVDEPATWRDNLVPASFRGAEFHVELGGFSSGRRVARHEFPKRNLPYSEYMGRKIRICQIKGYLIVSPTQPDYTPARDLLVQALEADGPGQLVHPTLGTQLVMAEPYTVTESREKGGYCEFDMVFAERGQPVQYDAQANTGAQVSQSANDAATATSNSLDQNLGSNPSLAPGATDAFNAGLGAG